MPISPFESPIIWQLLIIAVIGLLILWTILFVFRMLSFRLIKKGGERLD